METCRQCHQPIVGRTKRATFCSSSCKDTWYLAKAKALTVERLAGRTCSVCGSAITSGSGKARTCSRVCGVRWQNEKRAYSQRAAWESKKQPCARCGNEIGPDRRIGTLYCSETCKRNALSARWRERSPDYMRAYLYGITPEEYAERLAEQGGRCAICRTDEPRGRGGWHVDHDHADGRIRGLLCHACNVALGNFDDDPARLRAAINYLEARPAS